MIDKRMMYAYGQLVKNRPDGKRPGYRGSDWGSSSGGGPAGGATTGGGPSSGGPSGPSGGGGGGGGQDRDPPSRPSRPPSKPAPSKPAPDKKDYTGSDYGFVVSQPPAAPPAPDNDGNIFDEVALVTQPPTLPTGPNQPDNPFATPTTVPYFETQKQENIDALGNLINYTPDKVNIPFMPLVNKGLGFLQTLGNKKNTQFFADNVAGKYGYGYGIQDYKDYMEDRMSGKVGAYGNEEQGQNAIDSMAGNNDGITSINIDDMVDDTEDTTDDTEETIEDIVLRFQGKDRTLNPTAAGAVDTDALRAMIQERLKKLYT